MTVPVQIIAYMRLLQWQPGFSGFYANILYSGWAAASTLIAIIHQFLKEYRDIDLISKLKSGGPRCINWFALLLLCLVLMISSSVTFATAKCRTNHKIIPKSVTNDHQDGRADLFCSRAAMGVGLGTSVAFVSLMILCELFYVDDHDKELLLQSEMLFSVVSSIALCWGAFAITGERGCTVTANTLWYSIWLSFILSFRTVLSCLESFEERSQKRKKDKKDKRGLNYQ